MDKPLLKQGEELEFENEGSTFPSPMATLDRNSEIRVEMMDNENEIVQEVSVNEGSAP